MKKLRIFVDTNIYLDFYRASEHSLNTLMAIIKLIKDDDVELILPKQVVSEFTRDKEIVYKEFVGQNFSNIKDPGFVDSRQIDKLNKLLDKIKKDYQKKFFNPRSKINTGIKELFDFAIVPEETSEILDMAYYRTLRGNPPRKNNNSFGDAVIWETLLKYFSDKDLIIVSRDGDFSSELHKKEIHTFLKNEWNHIKNKRVSLSDSLGEVINKITRKETVKKEAIQEEKKYSEYVSASRISELANLAGGLNLNQGISQSHFAFVSDIGSASKVSLLGERVCECCGKKLESYSALNRCYGCLSKVMVNCSKCGKSFFSDSFNITGQYICPDCSGNQQA